MTIDSFTGDYHFLSNFSRCAIHYLGRTYQTTEHAYQAAKTTNLDQKSKIQFCSTPGQAKRVGRNVTLREDWEEVKVYIMEEILRIKFSQPLFRHMLLHTGREMLIEGNHWGDTFWGVCDGKGKNKLGKLLMKIRDDLRVDCVRKK